MSALLTALQPPTKQKRSAVEAPQDQAREELPAKRNKPSTATTTTTTTSASKSAPAWPSSPPHTKTAARSGKQASAKGATQLSRLLAEAQSVLADRPTPMGGPVKKTSTAAAKSGRRGEKMPAVVKSAQQGSAAAHKQPTSNTATSARKQQQPKTKTRWTSMQRLLAEANTVFSSKPSPMGGIHPRDDSSKHAVGPSSAARAPAAGNATDPKKSATRPSAAAKVGRVCELQLSSSRVKGGCIIRGQEEGDCCQPA